MKELGLEISQSKLVPPSTQVVCLGILVDSKARTISISPEKLQEIILMCRQWSTKNVVSKTQFQSLLGSLLYICCCVKPARFFLNRMLQLLRDNHERTKIKLTAEFFKDLNWFNVFLKSHNGIVFYNIKPSNIQVHLDACLTGLGGIYDNMVYSLPLESQNILHITQIECLNIIVAIKIWAKIWTNKRISIFCDNLAVVEVLSTGKTKDSYLGTCARNVWMLMSLFNIQIDFFHIPGKANVVADLLSRWHISQNPQQKLNSYVPNHKWMHVHPNLLCLNFCI